MFSGAFGIAIPLFEVFAVQQVYASFLVVFSRDLAAYEFSCHQFKEESVAPVAENDVETLQSIIQRSDVLTEFFWMPGFASRKIRLESALRAKCTYSELATQLRVLREALEDDLQHVLVLHMPLGQAVHYHLGDRLLGPGVLARFPQLAGDIDEAAKCLGSGRATAAVFHLMRVMETGVQEFGVQLGVALLDKHSCEKSWNQILEEADKVIKALDKGDVTKSAKAELSALLASVKIAWRNEVMHPKASYTQEEAQRILEATKAFMTELATSLTKPIDVDTE